MININDVAKLAGVSISSVSRVLKDNYPVSIETRKKVLDAVQELNYSPNIMASSLKSRQVNLLGVILPNLKNNVIMSIAQSITEEAKNYGYMTLFSCSENNVEIEKVLLNLYRSSLVDAIIAASVMKDDSIFKNLQNDNIPVALFDRAVGNIDWVGEDGYSASYDMTQYIINRGHSRIAFIKGVQDTSISKDRYRGYLDAMKDSDLEVIPELQLPGDFKEDLAFDLVMELLSSMDRKNYPTAIFTANSNMARGAINAVLEAGLEIPGDISIASYGDLDLPKNTSPRIACIKQNEKEIGKLITDLIMRKIEYKTDKKKLMSGTRIIIPVTLVEGQSVRELE